MALGTKLLLIHKYMILNQEQTNLYLRTEQYLILSQGSLNSEYRKKSQFWNKFCLTVKIDKYH